MLKRLIFIFLCIFTINSNTVMSMGDTFMEDATDSPHEREFFGIVPGQYDPPHKASRTVEKKTPTQQLGSSAAIATIFALLQHIEHLNKTVKEQLETLPTVIATQLLEILPKPIETPRRTIILATFMHDPESLSAKDAEILILHLQRDEYRLIKNLELIALSKTPPCNGEVFDGVDEST